MKSFEIDDTDLEAELIKIWTKNLKSFEILIFLLAYLPLFQWTKNLKSFEIKTIDKYNKNNPNELKTWKVLKWMNGCYLCIYITYELKTWKVLK